MNGQQWLIRRNVKGWGSSADRRMLKEVLNIKKIVTLSYYSPNLSILEVEDGFF